MNNTGAIVETRAEMVTMVSREVKVKWVCPATRETKVAGDIKVRMERQAIAGQTDIKAKRAESETKEIAATREARETMDCVVWVAHPVKRDAKADAVNAETMVMRVTAVKKDRMENAAFPESPAKMAIAVARDRVAGAEIVDGRVSAAAREEKETTESADHLVSRVIREILAPPAICKAKRESLVRMVTAERMETKERKVSAERRDEMAATASADRPDPLPTSKFGASSSNF